MRLLAAVLSTGSAPPKGPTSPPQCIVLTHTLETVVTGGFWSDIRGSAVRHPRFDCSLMGIQSMREPGARSFQVPIYRGTWSRGRNMKVPIGARGELPWQG
jgi:hypothetical protein